MIPSRSQARSRGSGVVHLQYYRYHCCNRVVSVQSRVVKTLSIAVAHACFRTLSVSTWGLKLYQRPTLATRNSRRSTELAAWHHKKNKKAAAGIALRSSPIPQAPRKTVRLMSYCCITATPCFRQRNVIKFTHDIRNNTPTFLFHFACTSMSKILFACRVCRSLILIHPVPVCGCQEV